MPYLIAAVILIGLACAANLLLTFGVIRRLKAGAGTPSADHGLPPTLPVGSPLPTFAADTIDGARVDNTTMAGSRQLIGFFSTSCASCKDRAPEFLAYAAAEGFDSRRTLAIVQGPAAHTAEFVRAHLDAASSLSIAVEPEDGPLARSLGVVAFPQFYLVDADGHLESVALSIRRLPTTAGA